MNRRNFLKTLLALFGGQMFFRPVKASGLNFLLPPTTLHVTENLALVSCWLSQPGTGGELILTQNGQEVQRLPLAADELQSLIKLENLTPATTYEYRVEIAGIEPPYLDFPEPWGAVSFRTQPYEWPIRFVAIGDSGFGENLTQRLAEGMAEHDIAFMLHMGDVVYNMFNYNSDAWRNWAMKYYQPFRSVLRRVPHYSTVGNHDIERATLMGGQPFYFWAYPPINPDEVASNQRQWYSFTANDVRFLSLNSQSFYGYGLLDEQNVWLDAQLADTSYRTTIPFFHIPFWTTSSAHADDGRRVAEVWNPKFTATSGQIDFVLHGHSHLYEHIIRDGIHYITTGGGSTSIYGNSTPVAGLQRSYSLSHYLLGEIYEDHFAVTVYDVNNEIIDQAAWAIA